MSAVPNMSDMVSHYDSHFPLANVQFLAIEKIMQSIKVDPFIIYMVPDHKQNVFQIKK